MKIKCYRPAPEPNEKTIHLKNGTLHLAQGHFVFSQGKQFTMNRLALNTVPMHRSLNAGSGL